jgi:hypothetical protein
MSVQAGRGADRLPGSPDSSSEAADFRPPLTGGLNWSNRGFRPGDHERDSVTHGHPRLDPVKTDASVAVLPIPMPLVSILRLHHQRQLRERVAAGPQWRDTGLVFTTAHGGFVVPRNANRMFHDVCTKAEVPQLRVQALRHSCATLLFTMGVQPATVQRILRHSSVTVTTGTYVECYSRKTTGRCVGDRADKH